jgi:hypothetical protein
MIAKGSGAMAADDMAWRAAAADLSTGGPIGSYDRVVAPKGTDMDRPAHRCADRPTDRGFFSAVDRAGLRWGVDGVVLTPGGADGQDLARALQRELRHLPVVMLHDRLLPGGDLVEHLAIGPGGVTVVASWSAGEPPAVRARVTAVQELIGDLATVEGALCVEGEEVATRLHPLEVDGIIVDRPKAVAELAARDGDLRDYELTALVEFLDGALPPAL